MKSNLPTGWSIVPLDRVTDILDNIRIPINSDERSKRQGTVPYFGSTGQVGWIDSYLFDEEIVLLGEDAAPFFDKSKNVAFLVAGKSWVNNHAHVLRAKTSCTSNKYLLHFLNYFDYKEYVNGTTRLKLTQGSMKTIPVLLPPLAEQHRIVAQLEATMQKLEDSQERLEKLPMLLRKFRQAVLAAAVSGKLTEAWRAEQPQGSETGADLLDRIRAERRIQWEEKQLAKMKGKQLSLNDSWKQKYDEPTAPDTSELPDLPEGWAYSNLGYLKAFSIYGPRFSNDDYSNDGVNVLRTTDIDESGKVNLNTTPKINLSASDFAKYKVEKGDLLITRTGSLGTLAVFNDEIDAIPGAYLIHYRLLDTKIVPYIFSFLKSPKGNNALIGGGAGTGIVNINAPTIESIPIPIPPSSEQEEIIRQVNHYLGLADQLEARFEQAAALVEQLPQALLAKAFSGQLVPQDPNDEPASVLLERLGAEVAAPTKGKRGRKSKAMADAPLFD